jgi:hypothetical protein
VQFKSEGVAVGGARAAAPDARDRHRMQYCRKGRPACRPLENPLLTHGAQRPPRSFDLATLRLTLAPRSMRKHFACRQQFTATHQFDVCGLFRRDSKRSPACPEKLQIPNQSQTSSNRVSGNAVRFIDLIEPRPVERRRVAGRGHARRPWRPQ